MQKEKILTAPNIITTARILLSPALLFTQTFSAPFYTVYTLGGLTDAFDGFAARRTGTETEFGAKLDSIADIAFIMAALIKIVPQLRLKTWLWIWIGAIAAIRIANIVSGIARTGKPIMLHTTANKVTGFLLFASVFAMSFADMNTVAVPLCLAATFASIQEGCLIRTDG